MSILKFCTTLVLLGASSATLAAVNQPAVVGSGTAASSISAQWQAYDLSFHYFGFTTYYSCDSLEDRLEGLLRELGADADVRVTASGCFGFQDLSKSILAHIRVRMPVQTSGSDTAFPAFNKTVELRTGDSSSSGAGDCELLEEVRDQLLPAFKLHAVKDNLRCVPGQSTIGTRVLQVQALIAEKSKT